MLTLLHSVVPHCHGECADENTLSYGHHVDTEQPFIHILSDFFSNAPHPDMEGQVYEYVYQSEISLKYHPESNPDVITSRVEPICQATHATYGSTEDVVSTEPDFLLGSHALRGPPSV